MKVLQDQLSGSGQVRQLGMGFHLQADIAGWLDGTFETKQEVAAFIAEPLNVVRHLSIAMKGI